MNSVVKLFTAHPASVNENYAQHFFVASSFAFWLLAAGLAALVHALVPAMCEKTASNIILKLHDRMSDRH